jgi:hypothetical protein
VATETLKIVITADNKGALTSLQQTAAETDKFKMSLGDLNTRLSLLKERLNQATEPARITKLGAEIKNVTAQIDDQKAAFAKLGAETEKAGSAMGSGLNKAFSGLRMIANILPGIGLAGMFGLAFEGLGKLIEEFGLFTTKVSEGEKKLNDYNEVNKKANKDAGEQVSTLKSLYNAATDVNMSMDTRNKAAKELQDLFPKTYGNLSLEIIKSGEAKNATDELTKSIIAQAKAKAALVKISELEAQKLDIEDQKRKIDNAVFNENVRVKKPYTEASFGGGIGGMGGGSGAILSVEEQRTRNTQRGAAAIRALNIEEDALTARQNSLTKAVGEGNVVESIAIENTTTKTEKLSKNEEILKNFKESLEGLNNQLAVGFISKDLFDVEKLKIFDSALNALSKNGEKSVETFKILAAQQKILFNDAFEAKMKLQSSKEENITAPFEKEITKAKPRFINGVPQSLEDIQAQQDKINQAQQAKLGKKSEADRIEAINKALTETKGLMTVVNPLVDTLFTAMQNGTDIGEALGDTFKKLAEDIAKAALKALIFGTILSAVTGGTSGALRKAGGFLGSIMGYAKGGISEGPQGGHIELLHGTEAILTPAQMSGLVRNSMNAGAVTSMGSNSQQQGSQQGEFTIRGNDLVLALQRSNYSLNLRRGV